MNTERSMTQNSGAVGLDWLQYAAVYVFTSTDRLCGWEISVRVCWSSPFSPQQPQPLSLHNLPLYSQPCSGPVKEGGEWKLCRHFMEHFLQLTRPRAPGSELSRGRVRPRSFSWPCCCCCCCCCLSPWLRSKIRRLFTVRIYSSSQNALGRHLKS